MTRPKALVQAANSKTPCIYATLGTALSQAEAATGVNFRCLEVFVTGSTTWRQWVDPWVAQPRSGYEHWVAADPTQRTLVITTNLVPNGVAAQRGWRQRGASGAYDANARRLATNLVKAGLGFSVIRLGPEMNGPWEVDWIGPTATEQRLWAEYFARIVQTMRAVRGAHFLFDWNVNAGYKVIPLTNFYPGNDVVDIVGIDAYDESPLHLPPVGSATRWPTLIGEPLGLQQVYTFAVQHHRPVSIPEWGTLGTSGDDGAYVQGMGRFIATHDVAYQCWFDRGDNHILQLSSQAPQTLAAYIRAFGHATSPKSGGAGA